MAGWSYSVEVLAGDLVVASLPASIAVALEDARFEDCVQGLRPNDGSCDGYLDSPVFEDRGYARGERVVGVDVEGPTGLRHYDLELFASTARAALLRARAERELPTQQELRWQVVAHERASLTGGGGLGGRLKREPFPLEDAALSFEDSDEHRFVRLAPRMVETLRAYMLEKPLVERAALLMGRVLRDVQGRGYELRVLEWKAVEPGGEGASDAHFAFDPLTMAAVHREASAQGLTLAGWAHSHPPCAACFALEAGVCPKDFVFFSADDRDVHRSAFDMPYAVGIVFGKVADRPALQPGLRVYGWQQGGITLLGEPRLEETQS